MFKHISGISILICFSIILFNSSVFAFEDLNQDGMIVRICPPPGRLVTPHGSRCYGYPFSDLMENPNDWDVTRSSIDYFGYASWILNDNFTNTELASYFATIDSLDLSFVLGSSALKDLDEMRTGEQCYARASEMWIRYDSLGMTLAALGIDEPLTAAVQGHMGAAEFPNLTDVEYAIRETADWLELVRSDSIIGDLPVSLSEAYPRTTYPGTCKDDLLEFIVGLQDECEVRGIEGISDLALDYNWCGYSSSNYWNEVIEIEAFADSIELPFAMIFWPARSYYPSNVDKDFFIDIMYQANLYFNTYGGSPDIIDVTAWDYIPVQQVPESYEGSQPIDAYPFTYSFLRFFNAYIDGDDKSAKLSSSIVNTPSISFLSPNPTRSRVTVQFDTPDSAVNVRFEAFDVCGRMIRTEDIGATPAGNNTYSWDGCTSSGELVSTGIYFVQMTFDGRASDVSPLLVLK